LNQIKISSLSYTYPNSQQAVLHDVSLEIKPGAFVLVVGESGSGKSTLLRCLNGLVPHFSGGVISGSLRVNGLDPVREGPSRMALEVGMVFQDPESQFVLDRVEDEIAFALENAALPRAEMHARVDESLQQMEIESLRHRTINSLSGGEQQRVAIAAALVLRPRILVLDEPTSQLDPEAADDVMDALARLNRERGLTILLAEHRVELVLTWVDQMILVEAGQVTEGTPQEILARTDLVPPVVALGKALGLSPLPLSVEQASIAVGNGWRHDTPAATQQPNCQDHGAARLAVADLRTTYGECEVLRGVDVVVQPGEVVALMDRNGAGKSTLLKSVVGLVKTSGGDIRVNGDSVLGHDTWDICRDVAYLPQNPNALLFADTVVSELETTLSNHGLMGKKDVSVLIKQLGLERYREAYPRDLIVGERERVAVVAVTVTEPKLLLLDEPTRGLDYGSKRALADLLRHWKAKGAGVVLVTHDVEFVAECADRVVMLAEGKVIADGAPGQVLGGSPVFAPHQPGVPWHRLADCRGCQSRMGMSW
jgi:energy-coupling factor transport system ATP-binding protein